MPCQESAWQMMWTFNLIIAHSCFLQNRAEQELESEHHNNPQIQPVMITTVPITIAVATMFSKKRNRLCQTHKHKAQGQEPQQYQLYVQT
jgi:hypothetical protein